MKSINKLKTKFDQLDSWLPAWPAILVVFLIVLSHFLLHPVRILAMPTSIFYLDEQVTLAVFFTLFLCSVTFMYALQNLKYLNTQYEKFLQILFAFIFAGFAVDEYFEVHEYLNGYLKYELEDDSVLEELAEISWVLPLSVVLLFIIGALMMVVYRESVSKVRRSYIFGILCLIAVVVLEFSGANSFGQDIYVTYVGLEEGLEMLAISSFLNGIIIKRRLLESP